MQKRQDVPENRCEAVFGTNLFIRMFRTTFLLITSISSALEEVSRPSYAYRSVIIVPKDKPHAIKRVQHGIGRMKLSKNLIYDNGSPIPMFIDEEQYPHFFTYRKVSTYDMVHRFDTDQPQFPTVEYQFFAPDCMIFVIGQKKSIYK